MFIKNLNFLSRLFKTLRNVDSISKFSPFTDVDIFEQVTFARALDHVVSCKLRVVGLPSELVAGGRSVGQVVG